MRINLLFCLLITSFASCFAQQAVITGDTMLCPNGSGTAMVLGIVPYDSYQWQVKAYLQTEFADIEGATQSSFTYDAFNYSVSYIRCEVSQNGDTFFSNELFIDSMIGLPIFYSTETDGPVTINNENGGYLICPGGTITNTISGGATFQWYNNDEPIPGATNATFVVTEPGVYYASVTSNCDGFSLTLPQEVVANPNCAPTEEAPVIEGDVLLCPGADGTAEVTNEVEYDTYQWQVKFNDEEEFADVEGATGATFTYGQFEYSVSDIRVEVTLDGETYYSNELFIDGHAWAGLFVMHSINDEEPETDSEGNMLICPGDEIINSVNSPYTIVQWYQDGEAIEGATETTYLITEPGEYYVVAAPDYCPESTSTSIPFTVVNDPDCLAGIADQNAAAFTLYPNPANSTLNLSTANGTEPESYTIADITGKTLLNGTLTGTDPAINIQALAAGSYIISVSSPAGQASKIFIKQ
jgi:hypothetical protein